MFIVKALLDDWVLIGKEELFFREVGFFFKIFFKDKTQLTQRGLTLMLVLFFRITIHIGTCILFILRDGSLTGRHLPII